MSKVSGLAAWFVYKRGRPFSVGNAQYGFLGDGSIHVPFNAVPTFNAPRHQPPGGPGPAPNAPYQQVAGALYQSAGQIWTYPLAPAPASADTAAGVIGSINALDNSNVG